MLILRNFLIIILLTMLAAISVVGLMVEFPPVLQWTPDRINELGRSVVRVMRPGLLLFIIWWLLLLGTLVVLFITIARPRRRMKIEVQMGGGRVVIMDAAIKKYIRSALTEIDDVQVKKIDLLEQRGQVTTEIYADVRTRDNLPVLERRIISRVRTALAEDLGITNLGDVHVFIKNFEVTGRPIAPAPAPADQPEDSAAISETSEESTGKATAPEQLETEPVIGGETATDAEHHLDETPSSKSDEPLIFPSNENATRFERPDDVLSSPDATVTETSDVDQVVLAEKPLPAQDSADVTETDDTPVDDKDLDDHTSSWDSEKRDDDNAGGTRNL